MLLPQNIAELHSFCGKTKGDSVNVTSSAVTRPPFYYSWSSDHDRRGRVTAVGYQLTGCFAFYAAVVYTSASVYWFKILYVQYGAKC